MLLDAPVRYGQHYKHARATAMYLTLCIKSIELDRADMFGRLEPRNRADTDTIAHIPKAQTG
jgi:hypothetical protein